MKCPYCGNNIAENNAFCGFCGNRLASQTSQQGAFGQPTQQSSQQAVFSQPSYAQQSNEQAAQFYATQQSYYTANEIAATNSNPTTFASTPNTWEAQTSPQNVSMQPQNVYITTQQNDEAKLLAAFIFCVISTLAWAVTIIGLAWAIPMTVHCYGIYKGKKRNTVAFAICTLIFMSIVSGILLLLCDMNTQPQQTTARQ